MAAALLVAAAACAGPASAEPLGTNLAVPANWSTELPFVDVFRTSRPWTPDRDGMPFGAGGPLRLDRHGWVKSLAPGEHAATVMLANGGHYPSGRYTVLYRGAGTLDFMGSARVASAAPGRIEVDYPPGRSGLWVRILTTDASDPVRAIHVLMPGHERTFRERPFNPALLRALRPYGALRFMQWMAANDDPPARWADRPTDASRAWTAREGGVPAEVMVALANEVGADPWFTLPDGAGRDYVRRFAGIVRSRLRSRLVPHVELSNETWNAHFPQHMGIASQAQRSTAAFRAWRRGFGRRPFLRVLASQLANPSKLKRLLDLARGDEAAVGAYFGDGAQRLPTAADVLARSRRDIRGNVRRRLSAAVAIARGHGLPLVAYEGGQGMYPRTDRDALVTAAANRSPVMHDLYAEHLRQWSRLGGRLFMAFEDVSAPAPWGSWGALEYLGQDPRTAPKHRALVEWARGGR